MSALLELAGAGVYAPLQAQIERALFTPRQPRGARLWTRHGWLTLEPGATVVERLAEPADAPFLRDYGRLFAATCLIQTPSIERMLAELDHHIAVMTWSPS